MAISITEFDRLDPVTHKDLIQAINDQQFTFQSYPISHLAAYRGTFEESVCKPFEFRDGTWCASRWVGEFHIGKERWEIQPRIEKDRFHLITRAVLSATIVKGANRNIGTHTDKLDLLPLVWGVAFGNARQRHGLPRAYVRREAQDCTELRGELDLERQLVENQLARKQYLACRWDDLTLDNPINQGTRFVIDHLRHHRRFPFHDKGNSNSKEKNVLRGELDHWRERLPLLGVTKPAHFPMERGIRWSRANDGFRLPHHLAGWLVENRGQTAGHTSAPAVLIDSAEVWELYLRDRLNAVVSELNKDWSLEWPRSATSTDYLLHWEGRKVRGLIPDFLIVEKNSSRIIAVLDAKYRWYRPPSDDVEIATQMAFYVANAGAKAAAIINGSVPLPVSILLFPRSPDFNNTVRETLFNEAHLMGRGIFQLSTKPQLFAWCIGLPDPSKEADFHKSVEQQLHTVLKQSIQI